MIVLFCRQISYMGLCLAMEITKKSPKLTRKKGKMLVAEDDDWSNTTWPSQTVDKVACTLKMPSWFIVQTYGGANGPMVGHFRTLQFKGSRRMTSIPQKFNLLLIPDSSSLGGSLTGSLWPLDNLNLFTFETFLTLSCSWLWLAVWECAGCHWNAVEQGWGCETRWHKARHNG